MAVGLWDCLCGVCCCVGERLCLESGAVGVWFYDVVFGGLDVGDV